MLFVCRRKHRRSGLYPFTCHLVVEVVSGFCSAKTFFFFFFVACRVFSAVTGHLSERGKSFRPAAVLKKLPDQCSSFHGAQSDKYGLIGQAFGLCSGHLCCFAAPLCPLQKKKKTSASCSLDETSLSNELFLKLVLPFFNLAWHPG